MIRQALVEQIIRQVYGEQPNDDAAITPNLVNQLINQGLGLAAKQNYKDAIQLDGVGYVNNSFYSTFSGITVSEDTSDNFQYSIILPQVPTGIATNEGVSTVQFKSSSGLISKTAILMTMNQAAISDNMRPVQGKILAYPQGNQVKIKSTILLNIGYTATVKMVSGGDATDLTSSLNCPDDYIPLIVQYCTQQLMLSRAQPMDTSNDGSPKT